MEANKKKVLVAVDGSDQSFDTVRYVGDILASLVVEVVLFHIQSKIDDAFWDMGVYSAYHTRIADIGAWDVTQKNKAKEFMNHAREILLGAGFSEESIKVDIHEKRAGVARDIVEESKNGYSAVVVGRKGVSRLKDLVIGSVAHKLVEKLLHVPVWVVGGTPRAGKILLPFDGSDGSMKAVRHVGEIMGSSGSDIGLVHVTRSIQHFSVVGEMAVTLKQEREIEAQWAEDAKAELKPKLDRAKAFLMDAGFDADRISFKFITGTSSRAGAIVEEARREGYGTIVLGRRGLSRVAEFFMGSVSNKVLHMAKEMAVWVVE
jgi:nucleotide-binding universal stress UspA family protein